MGETTSHRTTYLALDELAPNPELARRLPADLAWRFHALPLAEDNGRITVAMADPDDAVARHAVINALGSASCVVRADPTAIDSLLSTIWSNGAYNCVDVVVCGFPDPVCREISDYAQAVTSVTGGRIIHLGTADAYQALTTRPESDDRKLFLFGEGRHPLIHRLLSEESRFPCAVLVARQPRWPVHRILVIIGGDETDDPAVDWVVHLARATRSTVTVLAVVPPVPAMYGNRGCLAQGLPGLLSSDTPLGRRIQRTASHLVQWEIDGTLRLRQGPQEWQIHREVAEGNYDLVAVATRPQRPWIGLLQWDLVGHLLQWVERPVLVAKAATT